MAVLQYIANASFQAGTLASSYTSGGTSLSLTSGHGARFPSTGDFWLRIDDEIFKCTARSTDTLTVVGAQDGTSAANHSSASSVRWVLSVSALDKLRADIVRVGAVTSLPASGLRKQGDLYYTTDGIYTYVFDGSTWLPYFGYFGCTEPIDGDFAWINQSSATVSTAFGGIYLESNTGGTDEFNIRKKAAPATPYTITAALIPELQPTTNTDACGIGFRQSSDGKLCLLQLLEANNTGGFRLVGENWNSPTAFSSNIFDANAHHSIGVQPLFLRIEDDGANRKMYCSNGGRNWRLLNSTTRTTFLTADEVCFFVRRPTAGSTNRAGVHLIHWKAA